MIVKDKCSESSGSEEQCVEQEGIDCRWDMNYCTPRDPIDLANHIGCVKRIGSKIVKTGLGGGEVFGIIVIVASVLGGVGYMYHTYRIRSVYNSFESQKDTGKAGAAEAMTGDLSVGKVDGGGLGEVAQI